MKFLKIIFIFFLLLNINYADRPQQDEFSSTSWFSSDNISTFVCPDSSFSAISNVLLSADRSIDIMVYEFWSREIYKIIDNVTSKGVRVRVLLEKDTYSDYGTQWNMNISNMLYELKQEGRPVEIRLEQSDNFMHAKIMIIDESIVILGSENYMPTSFPKNPNNIELRPYTTASRGWGVVIRDSDFARECLDVFESIYEQSEDYNPNKHGVGSAPYYSGKLSYIPKVATFSETNVDVMLLKTPGNSLEMIKWMINHANYTILIEQMYIKSADSSVSELLNALKNARKRGVTIQIIVEDDSIGNYNEVKSTLISMGFHVVPAFKYCNALFLHNKGLIVDDYLVLVGSINWSGAALSSNTELGVVVKSRSIARFFREAFALDWNYSSSSPFDSDGDGLSNFFEIEHGFDPYKKDSDGDGISDYDEVYLYGNVNTFSSTTLEPENNTTIIILVTLVVVSVVMITIIWLYS
ncbi:MAG: phospholipase D-like domain-containing protein, partial [Candidatus Njordarchaeota archaeon]